MKDGVDMPGYVYCNTSSIRGPRGWSYTTPRRHVEIWLDLFTDIGSQNGLIFGIAHATHVERESVNGLTKKLTENMKRKEVI